MGVAEQARVAAGPSVFVHEADAAAVSLARLVDIDGDTVLFGHGDPWRRDARAAVEATRVGR